MQVRSCYYCYTYFLKLLFNTFVYRSVEIRTSFRLAAKKINT